MKIKDTFKVLAQATGRIKLVILSFIRREASLEWENEEVILGHVNFEKTIRHTWSRWRSESVQGQGPAWRQKLGSCWHKALRVGEITYEGLMDLAPGRTWWLS